VIYQALTAMLRLRQGMGLPVEAHGRTDATRETPEVVRTRSSAQDPRGSPSVPFARDQGTILRSPYPRGLAAAANRVRSVVML
jgi:hypothetical protein